ncbi:MAG: hypothetical protein F4X14_20570 [Caldilineaceae bacterium SB0661_bin_32]|uniref:Uncharacterized protein n=1 Tax=Caldilineaceae bacterium SB0661_bin_32 TaxID=2605255 RepID=A0A6B1DDL9_9CHLR|nr:hypothetical protein [Caldilineaceae bacterium SB0661_bin_32]
MPPESRPSTDISRRRRDALGAAASSHPARRCTPTPGTSRPRRPGPPASRSRIRQVGSALPRFPLPAANSLPPPAADPCPGP